MAKTKTKARKTAKARTARAKRSQVAQPKAFFKQPLEMLQNSLSSVINYFK